MEQILINDSFIDSDLINHKGQKYPRIIIQHNSIVKPSIAPEYLNDVFLKNDKNFFKRLINHYRSKGFVSMLNFINDCYVESINNDENNLITDHQEQKKSKYIYGLKVLNVLATIILYIRFLYLTIHFYFYPFDKYSDDELLQEFNPNPDWKSSMIRSFAWHQNSLRCALALINDLIYIYTADDHRPINHIVCLKNVQQKRVTAMCWHPKRDDILAVACQNKILIWTLKSDMSGFQAKDTNCLQIINTKIYSPLTSIDFNSDGDQLVACSPRNSSISIIKLENPPKVELIRKLFLPQFTSLNWSPDQTRLFAHTTTPKLCIFESKKWTYKFWKSPENKICQTSVWSRPTGRILLFVPKKSSKIYALTFYERAEAGDVGGVDQSIMVFDTRQQMKDTSFECSIHQICWDSKSIRLAIFFQDQPDTIAIYATQLNPTLQIRPLCILKSDFSAILPVRCLLLSFHGNYIDPGSLLTICWSNGFLTHIPLKNDCKNIEKSPNSSNHAESSIRSLTSLCTSFDISGLDNAIINRSGSICNSPMPENNGLAFRKNVVQSPDWRSTCTPKRATLYSTRVKLE